MMNRLLAVLLVAFVAVGSFALWRGIKENTSQPHVPTWKKGGAAIVVGGLQ